MITHTGEKYHLCNQYDKSFSQKSNLNVHMKSHTGEENHPCNLCSKSFSQKQNLIRHMIIHTGEKNHSCNQCDKNFACKSSLIRHMTIHTREKIIHVFSVIRVSAGRGIWWNICQPMQERRIIHVIIVIRTLLLMIFIDRRWARAFILVV